MCVDSGRPSGWVAAHSDPRRTTALSSSATTRLVNRLENRGLLTRILCPEDRCGIYTELTQAGSAMLDAARPTYDDTLGATLAKAERRTELAPMVAALHQLPTGTAPARG